MGRFIEAAKAGLIPEGSVLLVESVSRYTREISSDALGNFLADLKLGIGIAFTQYDGGKVITRERWDREPGLKFGLLAAMDAARSEWEEKQQRSLGACRKRRRLQDEGVVTPGRIPWWLCRTPSGDIELDPVDSDTVRRVVDLATNGLGQNRIASLMQKEQRPAPKGGARWTGRMVRHTLLHTALTGDLVRKDRTIHSYYPAVLSPAEHLALRQALAKATEAHGANGRRVHGRFLFQGLVRCAHCGSPASRQRPNPQGSTHHCGYVRCQAAAVKQRDANGNLCPGGSTFVLLADLEAHCLTRLRTADWVALFRKPDQEDALQEMTRRQLDLAATLQRDQTRLIQLEERAEQLFENGGDDEMLSTANRATVKVRERVATLSAELAGVEQQLAIARSMPQPEQLASDVHATIAEYMVDVAQIPPMRRKWDEEKNRWVTDEPTADDEEILGRRAEFNRWLVSRSPTITFLLDVKDKRIALQIGGGEPSWQPLAPTGRKLALEVGAIDPSVHERSDGTVQVIDWDAGRGWDTSDIDHAG